MMFCRLDQNVLSQKKERNKLCSVLCIFILGENSLNKLYESNKLLEIEISL